MNGSKIQVPQTIAVEAMDSMTTMQKVRVLRRLVVKLIETENWAYAELTAFGAPRECWAKVEESMRRSRIVTVLAWMRKLGLTSDDALAVLELFVSREVTVGSPSALALTWLLTEVGFERTGRMSARERAELEAYRRTVHRDHASARLRMMRTFAADVERLAQDAIMMASPRARA